MTLLPIFIGSESDKPFLSKGLEFLNEHKINYQIIASSTHRQPKETSEKILSILKDKTLKVIIGGAATSTGLPGVIAGYLINTNIIIFGVRFIKEPTANIIEDASFNLSSMPERVPMAHTGFNEKGFYHACILASRILKQL